MRHAVSARTTFVLIARVPPDGVAGFQAYEDAVLPLLSEHGGSLERRLRNGDGTIEVHIVSFNSDRSFQGLQRRSKARRAFAPVRGVGGQHRTSCDDGCRLVAGPSQLPTHGIGIGRIALVAASAAMGGFLFAYDTAVINGAVDAIKDWSGAASWLLGFAVAGALLGSALGAWFAGPLADRHGRIAVMKIAAAIFFVSSIGTGLAWDIWR